MSSDLTSAVFCARQNSCCDIMNAMTIDELRAHSSNDILLLNEKSVRHRNFLVGLDTRNPVIAGGYGSVSYAGNKETESAPKSQRFVKQSEAKRSPVVKKEPKKDVKESKKDSKSKKDSNPSKKGSKSPTKKAKAPSKKTSKFRNDQEGKELSRADLNEDHENLEERATIGGVNPVTNVGNTPCAAAGGESDD